MRKVTREEHEMWKEHYKQVYEMEMQFARGAVKRLEEAINDANLVEIKHHLDILSSFVKGARIEYERMMKEIDAINREVKV